MIKRNKYEGPPLGDASRESLQEYRPDGRWTLRVGDIVTLDTVRVKGPSGRMRKLTGPILAILRQRNGTVIVDVLDPTTRHTRTAYAETATKRKRALR